MYSYKNWPEILNISHKSKHNKTKIRYIEHLPTRILKVMYQNVTVVPFHHQNCFPYIFNKCLKHPGKHVFYRF